MLELHRALHAMHADDNAFRHNGLKSKYKRCRPPLSLCPAHDPRFDARRYDKNNAVEKRRPGIEIDKGITRLVLPIPHLLEEMAHVNFLGFHFHHPRMLKHAPWCGSSRALFLEAGEGQRMMLLRIN